MAVQTRKYIIDDVEEFKSPGVEVPADGTHTLGLDGEVIVLDLSAANAEKLVSDFKRYARAGRRVRTARRARSRDRRPQVKIRMWAREQGYDVKDQGRIAAHIIARYDAAHSS